MTSNPRSGHPARPVNFLTLPEAASLSARESAHRLSLGARGPAEVLSARQNDALHPEESRRFRPALHRRQRCPGRAYRLTTNWKHPKCISACTATPTRLSSKPRTATPDQFTRGLLLALRSAGLTVEPVPLDSGRWLIDGVVWLEVIGASRDLAQARCDLRAAMHRQPTALVGYLLQFVKPLRWGRVQISDSWLGPLVKPPASAEDLKAQLAAIQSDILTNLLEGDEDET